MKLVLDQIMRKVRLLVGTGLAKLVDDAKQIQQLQVTGMADEVRSGVNRMQDYGFTSVPMADAEALLLAVGGNRNHLIAVRVDDGRYRKKNLADGEVCMYNKDGDYILLKQGRIIEVVSGTKLKVTAPTVEIVASSSVVITSPSVTMSGNLDVSGTITGGTVKQGAVVLGTHKHGGVTAGGSQTSTPV